MRGARTTGGAASAAVSSNDEVEEDEGGNLDSGEDDQDEAHRLDRGGLERRRRSVPRDIGDDGRKPVRRSEEEEREQACPADEHARVARVRRPEPERGELRALEGDGSE